MAALVRNLPWFGHATNVSARGETTLVKPEQIVLWISLAEWGVSTPHPDTPRFPALLDTGCNHNLLIQEQHLVEWAGLPAGGLLGLGPVRVSGRRATRLAAHVWLHRNRNGQRDEFSPSAPFLLEMPTGIAVMPHSSTLPPHPRLPLLGLRAFRTAGLQLHVDCRRCRVTIRTNRWFDRFA